MSGLEKKFRLPRAPSGLANVVAYCTHFDQLSVGEKNWWFQSIDTVAQLINLQACKAG